MKKKLIKANIDILKMSYSCVLLVISFLNLFKGSPIVFWVKYKNDFSILKSKDLKKCYIINNLDKFIFTYFYLISNRLYIIWKISSLKKANID